MITAADDFPLHQTSRAFRDPGVDRNLYDRFFFNGYPRTGPDAGSAFFAIAFGQYPGRNVMDGAFSIVADGVQHNVRGSRLLGEDRLDLHVGPIRVEILEPLRRVRVTVDAPEAGVSADLVFTARGPAFEEPPYRWGPGHLITMDVTRLTQNGSWSGRVVVAGREITIDDATWRGTRDRSWGIRGMGARDVNPAPDGPSQFYWLWAPLNFDDMNVIFDVNEDAAGTRWHGNAMVGPADPSATAVAATSTDYGITWRPGTRHADAFTLHMALPSGDVDIELRSRLTFYMMGIGYAHPTWGHGTYVGPDERTYDSFVTAEVDETNPVFQHVQILSDATRNDGAVGTGILEMAIFGPHAPSGLSGMLDMHA